MAMNATGIPADTTSANARARLAPILCVLGAIGIGWVFTRGWLYPALGVPDYAPMLLRPILGFLTAWWLIRRAGERWCDYGLRAPDSWPRLAWRCALLLSAVWLASRFVVPALGQALGATSAPSILAYVRGNALAFAGWLMIAWVVGGFIEELLFRGFLLNRIEAVLGGGRSAAIAAIAAVLGQALLFGALHWYQGSFGFVFAAMFATVYGTAYRLFGRTLWPLILVHGGWNSVAIWGAFAG